MAQSNAGLSTDEEPLKKIFDDGMRIFDNIEKASEATNSNSVQVWTDLKNNTKKKASRIYRAAAETGGGPATNQELSELEQRVLNVIGPQAATGIVNVPEIGLLQLSIKAAIAKFEKATNLVSMSGMFSKNESLEELPTETLQYLLLPALLGTLSLKLCNQPRLNLVNVAEIYFKDFLQRCKDYGVTDLEVPQSSTDTSTVSKPQSEQAKIASLVQTREAKIQRYKQMQQLKEQLSILAKAMEFTSDDETKREYFTKLLQRYINQAFDELSSIEQEKNILEYMAQHAGEPKPKERARAAPLKPVIIARDAVQKAVFGAGYPAIPALTVEEFYEQRVKEGLFPGACTTIPHTTIQNTEDDRDEAERIQKERLAEEDDPEELARQRNMDEYKDDHRRGWGNRYNRS